MKITLQVKLAPSPEQYQILLTTLETFNAACNSISRVAWEKKVFGKFALQEIVYKDVRSTFHLSAQRTIRAMAKVSDAYKTNRKTLCPFKPHGVMIYDPRILSFKGLSKVSLLTLSGRQVPPRGMGNYQKTRFSRGKAQADLVPVDRVFYLLVTLDIEEEPPLNPKDFIGIDLGMVRIATDSTGENFSGEQVEKFRSRYHHLRCSLQKKGTKSAKRKLKKIARKESRFRKEVNHVISKKLVQKAKDTPSGIGLEDLSHIRGRTTVRKSDRARHRGFCFHQLQQFIHYKAKIAGVPVVIVNARNSSRACSCCPHIAKCNRKSQSLFFCSNCCHTENADDNASKVISFRADKSYGLSQSTQVDSAQSLGTASRRALALAVYDYQGGIFTFK